MAAALELLGSKPADQVTVTEIARLAEVSVGGFYARFPSKDALFEHFYDEIVGSLLGRLREALSAEATAGLSANEVVRRYLEIAVDGFRRHADVLRQVAIQSRSQSSEQQFRLRVAESNRIAHGLLVDRLTERQTESTHREPALAVQVALTAVSGAMREYLLFPSPERSISDERLVEELTELFARYLGYDR